MAKVNLINPDIKLVGYTHRDQFEGDGYISLCAAINSNLQSRRGDELVPYDIRIRTQKQIHILGSQEDLEGFKEFRR